MRTGLLPTGWRSGKDPSSTLLATMASGKTKMDSPSLTGGRETTLFPSANVSVSISTCSPTSIENGTIACRGAVLRPIRSAERGDYGWSLLRAGGCGQRREWGDGATPLRRQQRHSGWSSGEFGALLGRGGGDELDTATRPGQLGVGLGGRSGRGRTVILLGLTRRHRARSWFGESDTSVSCRQNGLLRCL